ncbi:protein FAR1-RELATED SEQUENCE 5-like [Sesbania bispinosa]|nr:protein FAR1-RELATED SEQUENCE 5-like [Sesbania bispinosa]
MFNKVPKAVVTDGDGAMREAIGTVFPGSLHRLYSWHLHQNACENVKNPKLLEDFKMLIYVNFTLEKFEEEWLKVIEKHGLNNNKWVRKVYDLKRMWDTFYFKDNFFGVITQPLFVKVLIPSLRESDTSKAEVLRSSAVGASCNKFNKATHKNPHNFVKNIEAIHHLAYQMERQDGAKLNIADISRVVHDPTVVKTKGLVPISQLEISCILLKKRNLPLRVMEIQGIKLTLNLESLNHSKDVTVSVHGKSSSREVPLKVKKSNKKFKHNDVVKLTQESLNDRDYLDGTNADAKHDLKTMHDLNQVIYHNRAANKNFRQMHNDQRFTGMFQY